MLVSLELAVPKSSLPLAGARPVSLLRLSACGKLSPSDEWLVKHLKLRTIPGSTTLSALESGDVPPLILLSGWAARVRSLPDGRRQIVHISLPGDSIGLGAAPWAGDRLPVVTLTPVIVADAEPVRDVIRSQSSEHAGLIEACRRALLYEQIYFLNALVRLGQQTAYERLAHLLLELHTRLECVGLVSSKGFQLPVTQDVIAQALGLSLVHLSRTLRQMRNEGAISLQPGRVQLLNPEALAEAANFPHLASWAEAS
jgi:CRP-like cAMP-binding protein